MPSSLLSATGATVPHATVSVPFVQDGLGLLISVSIRHPAHASGLLGYRLGVGGIDVPRKEVEGDAVLLHVGQEAFSPRLLTRQRRTADLQLREALLQVTGRGGIEVEKLLLGAQVRGFVFHVLESRSASFQISQ